MSLTIEDGSGKSNADSYISSADASSYLASLYGADEAFAVLADSDAKDAILRRACVYIETVYGPRFSGYQLTKAQALSWPRFGAALINGFFNPSPGYGPMGAGGFYLASDEIPVQLGRAQAELARRINAGTDPRPDLERGGGVQSETVDVISVTYAPGASSQTRYQQIEDLLAPLLANPSSMNVGVSRA